VLGPWRSLNIIYDIYDGRVQKTVSASAIA
jgi:hypothetical protein